MKRICVLGNSHAASFKLAWDALGDDYPETSLTFFADRGGGLSDLSPENAVLTPRSDKLRKTIQHTSGGSSVVDLRLFDAVLLVGLYVFGWPDPLLDRHWDGFFSSAVTRQWLIDYTPQSAGHRLASKVRGACGLPMYLAHQPLLRCIDAEAEMDLQPYRANVALLNDIFRPLSTTCLEQPRQTITNGRYTKAAYSIGSTRLAVDDGGFAHHDENERRHMNEAFGRVWLADCLAAIGVSAAAAAPLARQAAR